MKSFVLIIGFLSIVSSSTYSQCVADAGGNVHRCSPDSSIQLGGSPTARGGSEPYIYEWSIVPIYFAPPTKPYLFASDILDDTTLANPNLLYNSIGDSIAFLLKVTDSDGIITHDTMILTTSDFGIHLYSWNYYIEQGDSLFLNKVPNIGAGYGETAYLWNPTHGLSDSTLASDFWAKPDSSISYTATVTDSKGCVRTAQEPTYHIYVNSLGLNEYDLSNDVISLYPNPMDGILQIQSDEQNISNISIYSNDGTKQFQHDGNPKFLNLENLSSGIYVIEFRLNNGKEIRKKIVRK